MKILNENHIITGNEYFRQIEFCPYDSDNYAKSTFISHWVSIRYLLGYCWLNHKLKELDKPDTYYPMNPTFLNTYEFIEFDSNDEKELVSKFKDDTMKRINERMYLCYRNWPDWTKHYLQEVSKEKIDWIKKVPIDLCPLCNKGEVVKKNSLYGSFYGCNRYPKCKYTENKLNDLYSEYYERKTELIALKAEIKKLNL